MVTPDINARKNGAVLDRIQLSMRGLFVTAPRTPQRRHVDVTPFFGFELHSPGIGDGVGRGDRQRGDGGAGFGRGTGTGLVTRGVHRRTGPFGDDSADTAEHQRRRGDGPGRPGGAVSSRRFRQPGRGTGFRVLASRQNPIMRLHRDDPLTDFWSMDLRRVSQYPSYRTRPVMGDNSGNT